MRVVAQTVKDKKFSHWTFNGTPICYSSPYTFTVYGDTTIEAVYVDAGEEVTPQAASCAACHTINLRRLLNIRQNVQYLKDVRL